MLRSLGGAERVPQPRGVAKQARTAILFLRLMLESLKFQVKEEYMERVTEWVESIGEDLIVNDVHRSRFFLVL